MKVVRQSILDKINDIIDKNQKDTVRIELTPEEFKDLLKLLDFDGLHVNNIRVSGVTFNPDTIGIDYSGSSLIYRGVCIQTHHTYKE